MRIRWAYVVLLALFASSCGRPGDEDFDSDGIGVAAQGLGPCVLTEIPCTTDAQCARDCAVGTCDVSGRCRMCAQDPGYQCRAGSGVCDAPEVCNGVSYDCPADTRRAAGTVCRASTSACDVGEVCDGSSVTCPSDGFASASTVCRAAAGGCDVAEMCSGSSATCPADTRRSAGFTCRAATSTCDVAEVCDGTSTACPNNAFAAAGTMCRASSGACDVADTCSGTSATCIDARVAAGITCRAAVAGGCDVAEVCDGTASTCPTDAFAAMGTTCRGANGVCDRAEVCSGSTASCPSDTYQASGTVCRGANGACDVAETCSGSSTSCPGDAFASSGTVCRADAGDCDGGAEVCTGSSAACPADANLSPAGTVCRAAAGVCDRAETCNGTSGACPTNSFLGTTTVCRASTGACDPQEVCAGGVAGCPGDAISPAGTVCGPATAPCDAPEVCNGTAVTCPSPTSAVQPAGTVCRAAVAGGCDIAEVCDGAATTCPSDAFQPNGTMCRAAAAGGCDVADTCTGTNATCTNRFVASGTVCRASAGDCDVAESCTGSSAACPNNTRVAAGTVCRNANGVCDAAETCTGSTDTCPTDRLAAAGTVCRANAGACDRPETCDGNASTCPSDQLQPSGALCRASTGPCDATEFCSGSNAACPTDGFNSASTVCRPVAGDCDVAENCSGSSAACPTDAFRSNGTVCRAANGTCDRAETCAGTATCPSDSFASVNTNCDPDGTVCNGTRVCNGSGTCGSTSTPLDCDDDNPCTADSCDPVAGCRHTPVNIGSSCNDGLYCTVNDVCRAGGSCSGDPRSCGAATEECLIMECDEASDRCVEAPNPSGTPCVDRSIKPRMLVVLDNSGTMSAATGSGVNSCSRERTRISDAKCVLSQVVSSYGDIVFGLERFRQTTSGSCGGTCPSCGGSGTCPATCSSCSAQTIDCGSCDPSAASPAAGGCPTTGGTADQGEILTPLVDDNQTDILRWVDYTCNSCSRLSGNAELTTSLNVYTPIAGSLRAARRYLEGNDPSYPSPVDTSRTCTPYYVIVITDGTEACTTYSDAVAAATELRTTRVGSVNIDVHTYTIGVGIDPASFNGTRLREIAVAGGTTPFFADDESSISLAFAQILEDSLLVEVCNGADDDCDSRIDEGFTLYCDRERGITSATLCVDPGDPCDNEDDNCARGTADEVRNACGVCGATPVEVCDRVDNDCDGNLDEAPANCSCIAEPEVCDGLDNDCDGVPDDGLTRPCGSDVGICTRGTQTCTAGAWGTCSGALPMTELCNGVDDDCDGVVDGFTRPCGPMPVGRCAPGVEVCTSGAWGACSGALLPETEICDLVDNDCDGNVDEADASIGVACETTCGAGAIQCRMGMLACVASGMSTVPEVCNNYDDDCDGNVDEGIAPRGPCDNDGLLCVPGEERCVDGLFQCIGGAPPEVETCDCVDNDCNDAVDDNVSCGAVGDGSACLGPPYCRCARPCSNDEFPCPAGFRCTDETNPSRGYCVADPCNDVDCPPEADGTLRTCEEGQCVSLCSVTTCDSGLACNPTTGRCVTNDCYGFPNRCPANTLCVAGECEGDSCANVTCADGQFCRNGDCVPSCGGVVCPTGQRCSEGECSVNRCGNANCDADETCDPATGMCVDDECVGVICPLRTVCEPLTGRCVRDPCLGVECPGSQECFDGDCYGSVPFDVGMPDGGGTQRILAAGGCVCRAGTASQPRTPTSLGALGLLGLLVWRRRRARRASLEGGVR